VSWRETTTGDQRRRARGRRGGGRGFSTGTGKHGCRPAHHAASGAYTAHLTASVDPNGASAGETSGNALMEIYEADRGPSSLANLSCRARIGGEWGDRMAGFVLTTDRDPFWCGR